MDIYFIPAIIPKLKQKVKWVIYHKFHGSVNHRYPPRRIGVQATVFPLGLFSKIISKTKTKNRLGKQECKSKMDGTSSSRFSRAKLWELWEFLPFFFFFFL